MASGDPYGERSTIARVRISRSKYNAAGAGTFLEVQSLSVPEGSDPRVARFPDEKGLNRTGSQGSTASNVSSVEEVPTAGVRRAPAAPPLFFP